MTADGERGHAHRQTVKPQVVAHELCKRLPDNAIVSCDSGTITTWWARHIRSKRGQMHSVSGTLATMACGLPYTIAAQIAYPDRPCIGFVGDGGFSMLMCEFLTAVKYQLPIKIVIIKNNVLGQIKWEQMVFLGNPEFGCELEAMDFVLFAQACGGHGFRITDAEIAAASSMRRWRCADRRSSRLSSIPTNLRCLPRRRPNRLCTLPSRWPAGPRRGRIIETVLKDTVREMV